MGVLIAHGSATTPEEIRRVALGAGLECAEPDVVPLTKIEVRQPQVVADLVLIAVGGEPQAALKAAEFASQHDVVPIVAIGPTDDPHFVMQMMRAGVREFVDENNVRDELDSALDKLAESDDDPRIRGTVISVFSPSSGSGTTTIASNLAGALGKAHPGDVALMELTRHDGGDLALFFDIEPQYTVQDVCERIHLLDATSLGAGLIEHPSGVAVLAHDSEQADCKLLQPDAVRRVAVLLRSMFSYTVLDLDHELTEEQLEALKLSDIVVFVVRPDVPSVRRAQRVLEEAIDEGLDESRLRLVVNRWGQSGQLPLRSIAETLELEPFQLIPDDPRRVNTAVNQGSLLQQIARGAGITRRFAQLASSLNGRP